MIVLAALNEDSFWAQNRAFNAQKYSQGELGRRFGRLFLILNTAINQKIQKKIRIIGTLGTSSIYTLTARPLSLSRSFVGLVGLII